MSPDRSTSIAGHAGAAPIAAIAAELAKLHARLEYYGDIANMTPAQDREWQQLYGEMRDLEDALTRARPRDAREALATAAVCFAKVRDLDEVCGDLHAEAFALAARALERAEAEAGVTAAELGLGVYSAGCGRPQPVFGDDDGGRGVMQMAYDAGYLAAVSRFAPTFAPYVKAELDRARAASIRAVVGTGEMPTVGSPAVDHVELTKQP